MEKTIKLNVGGYRVETLSTTLTSSNYFQNLLEGPMENQVLVNDNEIFIDRSGVLFKHIIQYLRTGKVQTTDPILLRKLEKEAEFFQLDNLQQLIQEKTKSLDSQNHIVLKILDASHLHRIIMERQNDKYTNVKMAVDREEYQVISYIEGRNDVYSGRSYGPYYLTCTARQI